MKILMLTLTLVFSTNLLANDTIQLSGIPNYLQRLEIKDALNSINSGESTEVILTSRGFAMSESFFVANPIGYLDAPSEQAKNDAKTTASNDCQRITGIGEVTQVFESDGDCNLEDGWPELIRKYWICTAMDTYGCKITKP